MDLQMLFLETHAYIQMSVHAEKWLATRQSKDTWLSDTCMHLVHQMAMCRLPTLVGYGYSYQVQLPLPGQEWGSCRTLFANKVQLHHQNSPTCACPPHGGYFRRTR